VIATGQASFLLHLGLGVAMVHGYAGGLSTLLRRSPDPRRQFLLTSSTVTLTAAAWATVITGTWLVYPGYRAKPEPGESLIDYPQKSLQADDATAVWHDFGMEWKEHVGWVVPALVTVVAFLALRHRTVLEQNSRVRRLAAGMLLVSLVASIIAAGLGAVINIVAPNQFLDQ
jgi:uncharacterized membrane protein